jgi:hypothetical protein
LVNGGQYEYKGLREFEGVKLNCVDRDETRCCRTFICTDEFLQPIKTTELSLTAMTETDKLYNRISVQQQSAT